MLSIFLYVVFFFKQKTAYEMRISDWSSDVCSSDLTELFREFFQAFVQNAGATLHVENLYGGNTHHIVETCFKGLARALRQAVEIDERAAGAVPSTKGTLSAQGTLSE